MSQTLNKPDKKRISFDKSSKNNETGAKNPSLEEKNAKSGNREKAEAIAKISGELRLPDGPSQIIPFSSLFFTLSVIDGVSASEQATLVTRQFRMRKDVPVFVITEDPEKIAKTSWLWTPIIGRFFRTAREMGFRICFEFNTLERMKLEGKDLAEVV